MAAVAGWSFVEVLAARQAMAATAQQWCFAEVLAACQAMAAAAWWCFHAITDVNSIKV